MPRTGWNKRLTPEIEQIILTQYLSGVPAPKILESIPFKTAKTIYDVLEKRGIPRRSSTTPHKDYHEGIFATIDTPEKAYWLGLLIADGYVSDTRPDSQPIVGIQLVDKELLEKFRQFLGVKSPLLHIGKKTETCQTMYRLAIHSKRMATDLAKYGVVPRKSNLTFLPILSHHLMSHMIRGICDGDGTISHRTDRGIIIGFCGSHRLITELRIWLISKLEISDNKIHQNGAVSIIQWSNRVDMKKIVQYLYQDAEVYLERKYSLIQSCLIL